VYFPELGQLAAFYDVYSLVPRRWISSSSKVLYEFV